MAGNATVEFFVFLALEMIGCILSSVSIAGIILSSIAKRKGKKFGKPLLITSIIAQVLSFLLIVISSLFLVRSMIALNNQTQQEPVTGIIIEEEFYQDERFTADGVVYERIEIDELWPICSSCEPVFSYVSRSDFSFRKSYANYNKLTTENGFNIVVGEGEDIFCPVDEKEEAEAFYSDDNNYQWYFDGENNEYKVINDDGQKFLNELHKIYKSNPETENIKADIETAYEYSFEQFSKDGNFSKDIIKIFEYDGKYCLEISPIVWGISEVTASKVVKIDKASAENLIKSIE